MVFQLQTFHRRDFSSQRFATRAMHRLIMCTGNNCWSQQMEWNDTRARDSKSRLDTNDGSRQRVHGCAPWWVAINIHKWQVIKHSFQLFFHYFRIYTIPWESQRCQTTRTTGRGAWTIVVQIQDKTVIVGVARVFSRRILGHDLQIRSSANNADQLRHGSAWRTGNIRESGATVSGGAMHLRNVAGFVLFARFKIWRK